jgi:hypothetical protein
VVSVRIELNHRFIDRLLRRRNGAVARNMLERGERVKAAAQRNINSRSGALARSIRVEVVSSRGVTGARIGTNLGYARFVHDGTGIYGPSHRPIRPARAKVMAFAGQGAGGRTVYVRQTSGQRANPFLREALRAAG